MAIRKLTFSFDVPITQLLGLIATGNAGLKIDVVGDDKVGHAPKLINGHAPKLLEGPKRRSQKGQPRTKAKDENGNHAPSWHAILRALAKNPEHTKAVGDLGALLVNMGLSAKSVSPQLSLMKTKGWVRNLEPGVYQMTAKGGVEAQRLGFEVADRKLKAKPHKKHKPTLRAELSHKKKPPPPERDTPATVTTEDAHGQG